MKRFAMVVASIAAGMAGAANAQTVLIDFGRNSSFRGVTVPNPDANGNTWNSIVSGFYYPDLLNTAGAATTVDFGFSTPVGTDSYNGPAGATSFPNPTPAEIAATDIDAAALGILGVKEAAIDFAASDANQPARFEIQGLDPSKTYDLKIFGSHKYNDNNVTRYSIFTDNTYTTSVATGTLLVGVNGDHNRDQTLTLGNVAPQVSNILYVELAGLGGTGQGYINSLALTVVPEPASMGLLALGGMMIVRRRRA